MLEFYAGTVYIVIITLIIPVIDASDHDSTHKVRIINCIGDSSDYGVKAVAPLVAVVTAPLVAGSLVVKAPLVPVVMHASTSCLFSCSDSWTWFLEMSA